jgi:hypothetical protein
MYHGYGCLHVVGIDGAINEGGQINLTTSLYAKHCSCHGCS